MSSNKDWFKSSGGGASSDGSDFVWGSKTIDPNGNVISWKTNNLTGMPVNSVWVQKSHGELFERFWVKK
jgi:hypothetical protein